jgi:glycerol-3-phosphate responsive antiterminator
MEHYSVIEKNEIMLLAGKWMELENIVTQIQPGSKGQRSHVSLIRGS